MSDEYNKALLLVAARHFDETACDPRCPLCVADRLGEQHLEALATINSRLDTITRRHP